MNRGIPADVPRIAVLGSHSPFTDEAVRALCESGVAPVALMVTGAARAAPTPGAIPLEVLDRADGIASAQGVPLIRVSDPNHPPAIAALRRIRPDLLLLACLPHIVGRATRETARIAALNLHPSILPRFRGPHPVFWQLHSGVSRAGATVHVAADAVDAGPVVVQRSVDVRAGIRAHALTAMLVRSGIRALVEALPRIERRIGEATPQDESLATRQPWPRPEDFRIDTSWTAERAYRFIEGVRGPGVAFAITGDAGEIEVERAVGFDVQARPDRTVVRTREIVAIRFAEGVLRAIPARPARTAQASTASASSNPNVDMSRMRDG